jgi:uncharacterized heparinase superfamily protein
MPVAENTRLSMIVLRGGLRRFIGRINGHPLVRWPLFPIRADRLVIAPQDLRTADATRASEIYSGRFAFAGKVVLCDGRSAFDMIPPSDEWAVALLGFGWLRHLRAADSGITRANARALVDEWITSQGSWHPIAGAPTCSRAASYPGSAIQRRYCTTPMCVSTADSCAVSCGRCAICGTPSTMRATACSDCRRSLP